MTEPRSEFQMPLHQSGAAASSSPKPHPAASVESIKVRYFDPAMAFIMSLTPQQRLLGAALLLPIVFIPALLVLVMLPAVLIAAALGYVLLRGPEKSQSDLQAALSSEQAEKIKDLVKTGWSWGSQSALSAGSTALAWSIDVQHSDAFLFRD